MGRKYTCMLLDMVDNDALSAVVALEAALGYMSELQVEDMMCMNGFLVDEEEYEDEDEDNACDGYLGDIDNLDKKSEEAA